MIYYSIPYSLSKNIGKAYNHECDRLPDDNDWICFTDGDARFVTPYYGHQLHSIIQRYPDCKLFTAVTNRVGTEYQCIPNMWDVEEYDKHVKKGHQLYELYNTECEDITHKEPLSGVVILIQKSEWKRVGGFKENGMLGIDNAIHKNVKEQGGKVMLMKGVYVFHYYRGGKRDRTPENKKHLLPRKQAVYTAIFGDYDKFREPVYVNPNYDYHLFTDQDIISNVFNIHKMESGDVRMARKVKILAHKFLNSYNYTIWHDANIVQVLDIDELHQSQINDIKLMKHPYRNCVYQELKACLDLNKGNQQLMIDQVNRYRNEGYPSDNGMVATGVIMRRNTPQVREFCEAWWKELERGSHRDQLSFNYVLRKFNFSVDLMSFSILERNFKYFKHK